MAKKAITMVHPVTEGLTLEQSAHLGLVLKRNQRLADKAFRDWEREHKPRQFNAGVDEIVDPSLGIIRTRSASEDDVLDAKQGVIAARTAGITVEERKDGKYTAEDLAVALLHALNITVPTKHKIVEEALVITLNV